MLKLSKFNFCTQNKKGELIIYNSYVGLRSLCKLQSSKEISSFEAGNVEKLGDGLLRLLIEKGIVINYDEEENRKMHSQILDVISPKTLNLIINPTEKCNFNCIYCYESFKHGEMTLDTQSKIISFVKDNIHNYTGLNVSWFGGEPLLSLSTVLSLSEKLLQICRFNKRSYSSNMTTNGYLLNRSTFQELINKKINNYQITVDGPKVIHNKQRVLISKQGTYDRIIDNLKSIKNSKIRNFSVVLRVNFTKEIFECFDDFLDDIAVFFDNDSRFTLSCYKVGDWGGDIPKNYKENLVHDASSGMRMIYKKILESKHTIPIRFDFLDPGTGLCYAGKKNNFLISSDGSLHKCTLNFEDEASTIGRFSDNHIELSRNYFKYVCVPDTCNNYYNCFFAPVCTGDPCPIKEKTERRCSFIKDNLDIILQIADKNGLVTTY